MINSILMQNKKVQKILVILFWILIWQISSMIIGYEILLASPLKTIKALSELIFLSSFWGSVSFSFLRITLGFFVGFFVGTLLAILSYRFAFAKILLKPFISVLRAVPIVSFIMLALLWVSGSSLGVFISAIIVIPLVYENILQGLEGFDHKLSEMAKLFRVSHLKRTKFITLPALMPWIIAASRGTIGLAWKSGIAAEVIGLSSGSIGERLYQAKINISTGELFAWTLVVVIISVLSEKLITTGLNFLQRRLCT